MFVSPARSAALVLVSAILVAGAAGCRSRGDVAAVPGSAQAIHANARKDLRNNNFEKDGETVYGMAFTAEEIDYLDSRAESEARRNGGHSAEGSASSGEQGAPAASTRKPRNARQPAHADA